MRGRLGSLVEEVRKIVESRTGLLGFGGEQVKVKSPVGRAVVDVQFMELSLLKVYPQNE